MNNIRKGPWLVEADKPPADADVVQLARDILRRAEAGEINGLAVIMMDAADGGVSTAIIHDCDALIMAGIKDMEWRLMMARHG